MRGPHATRHSELVELWGKGQLTVEAVERSREVKVEHLRIETVILPEDLGLLEGEGQEELREINRDVTAHWHEPDGWKLLTRVGNVLTLRQLAEEHGLQWLEQVEGDEDEV